MITSSTSWTRLPVPSARRAQIPVPQTYRTWRPFGVQAGQAFWPPSNVKRLLVPRAAVLRRSEVTAVYVVDADGRAYLRQVRLGTAGDEASVEVLAGLKPGERVALEPVKAGIGR